MASLRRIVPLLLVAVGLLVLVRSIASRPTGDVTTPQRVPTRFQSNAGVDRVNQWFENHWGTEQVTPVDPADEINILRRLSLALHGTVPSLEELRQFEADGQRDRLKRWTQRMLGDDRFPTYFPGHSSAVRSDRSSPSGEIGSAHGLTNNSPPIVLGTRSSPSWSVPTGCRPDGRRRISSRST